MTARDELTLKAARARIRELEARLEEHRHGAEAAQAQLARITGSRTWRILSLLRRAVFRAGRPPSTAPAPVERRAEKLPMVDPTGPAASFMALLPAESTVIGTAQADDPNGVLRRIDLRSVFRPVPAAAGRAGSAAIPLDDTSAFFSKAESTAAHLGFVGSEDLLRQIAFDAQVACLWPTTWRERLAHGRLDFVLVEAIRHKNPGDWRDAFAGAGTRREQLCEMLTGCRARGIPVVCWFREAVSSLDEWTWLCPYADALFAHDPEVAQRLRIDQPGRIVEWLPPAVQPARHNPWINPSLVRARSCAAQQVFFDGLAACLADGLPSELANPGDALLLADSRWEVSAAQASAHPAMARLSLGRLGEVDRNVLLRLVGAEFFNRGDSAEDQLRQMEAAACGALVVGPGVMPLLEVEGTGGGDMASWSRILSDPVRRMRAAHLKTRLVLSQHCIVDRLQTMAAKLGSGACFAPATPKVACLLVTRRPELLGECLRRFRADSYPNKELIVVVHGTDADLRGIRASIGPGESIQLLRLGDRYGLGACLNFAFEHTEATYWAKWDDDDLYGPHYLSDFMLYRRAIDFDVAGKPMAFTLLDDADELRWDSRWGKRANLLRTGVDTANTGVAGATLFGHRRVLEANPFPEHCRAGTDTAFLRSCHERGWNLLSTDPFNFVRYRTARAGFHTWQLTDQSIRDRTVGIGTRRDIVAQAFV